MTKKLLIDAVILLLLAVLGVVAYKLAPLLNPKTDVSLPLSSCNLAKQHCVSTLPDGGQLEFAISPRPIPALKPLKLEATIKGSSVRKVEVDFVGTDMKMGFNRPTLEGNQGRYTGQASLPVCITGTMEWDATVLIETATELVAVPFRFAISSE